MAHKFPICSGSRRYKQETSRRDPRATPIFGDEPERRGSGPEFHWLAFHGQGIAPEGMPCPSGALKRRPARGSYSSMGRWSSELILQELSRWGDPQGTLVGEHPIVLSYDVGGTPELAGRNELAASATSTSIGSTR
jgi:hypothetical protein